jgi:2-polyprenyl-6-methoxyphenol hydroxylase-like FAD-dependent oxidoreductase
MTEPASSTDVLIVGAGPAGLALATELTMRGVNVQVIEQNDRVGVQPRAKTTNVRTMEHMRRWGLAERVRSSSPVDVSVPRRVRFATSLFGGDIKVFDNALCFERRRDARYSENAEWVPQYITERVLLDHVSAHPLATVGFRCKLTGFEADAGGVTATIKDDSAGETRQMRARYLVGADGGRSTVRDILGFRMEGDASIASFVTLILQIPGLLADPDLKPAIMHWLVDPAGPCIMGQMDRDDTWFWGPTPRPGVKIDDAWLDGQIRHSLGGRYDFSILARDSWTAHKLLANRYRSGNVFLIGDACHLHSPFGGHGMNLGLGDSVDLGWKLAACLQGWGGPGLLESYELERRPVHRRVLDCSTENMASLSDQFAAPELKEDSPRGEAARARAAAAIEVQKTPEFRSLGLILGYVYADSPIVMPENTPPPAESVTEYRPTAYPGALAPHAWLPDGRSLYDLFGRDFTLLALREMTADEASAIRSAAARSRVPLELATIVDDRLRDLYGASLALVRPDQHVAWRGERLDALGQALDTARGAASRH